MQLDDPTLLVSHETSYTVLYAMPRGELRTELSACLRCCLPYPLTSAAPAAVSYERIAITLKLCNLLVHPEIAVLAHLYQYRDAVGDRLSTTSLVMQRIKPRRILNAG